MTGSRVPVGRFRDVPAIRELLARATWDELNRIATRHSVALGGRRRELAIDRLAAVLERPEQLRAAERILPENTRAVLGLLLLLQGADDERALVSARDALVVARPELAATLGRAHIGNEVQTLTSLGLVLRDRRRLNVPLEVLNTLQPAILPTSPGEHPDAAAPSFARVQFIVQQLVQAIEQQAPAAIQPPSPTHDRPVAYHALLLPPNHAASLDATVGVGADDVALLMAVLDATGAIGAARGTWRIRERWHELRQQPPREFLTILVHAWQEPRAISDIKRTGEIVWMYAPDVDGGELIAQHEAQLRSIVWRWLGWCGTEPFQIAHLARTLAALHGSLLLSDKPDAPIWPALSGSRGERLPGAELERVAQLATREWLRQLARLGLVVCDQQTCALTPLAAWLLHDREPPRERPVMYSDAAHIFVQPLTVDPDTLRWLSVAGILQEPHGSYACFQITPQGLGRLLAQHSSIGEFEQRLMHGGAQLSPEFRTHLTEWGARAGRVRLHAPLVTLVTAEDTPLAQVLAAAGLSEAAEVIGPGCAVIEPEYLALAVEQLRARGFWPRIIQSEQDRAARK